MSEGLPKSARDVLARQTAAGSGSPERPDLALWGEAAHPSADLLNAYIEQSLSDDENSTVLLHLAACANCREVVFLASGVAEEELLATAKAEAARVTVQVHGASRARTAAPIQLAPEMHDRAVGQPQPRSPRRWWKWAVPAFAAVLVVSVAILQHDRVQEAMSPAPQQMAKVEQPSGALNQPRTSPQTSTSRDEATNLSASNPPARSSKPSSSRAEQNETAAAQPAQKKELAEADSDLKQKQDALKQRQEAQLASNLEVSKDKRDMVVLSAPSAAAKAAPATEAKAGAPAARPPSPSQTTVEVTSAAPLVQADNADLSANFSPSTTNNAVGALQAKRVAPTRWRISNDGHVEHTVGPSTWARVMPAEPVTFHVVATIGHQVWAGGSDGALFHSSDGGHEWSRIGLAGEQGTITTIHFNDAQHGSLTTDAGTVWKTIDGGLTWTKQ